MRKFITIIIAILLAFLVFTLAFNYKQGNNFRNISFDSISTIWSNFFKEDINAIKESGSEKDKKKQEEPQEEELNLTYDERIEKGDYYYKRGFLSFALNEYVKASKISPDKIEPYEKLLITNFDLGDYSKAKANAEYILSKDINNYNAKFKLAIITIKLSDFENAKTSINSLLAVKPNDATLLYYKSLIDLAFDNYDDAKKSLKKALSISTDENLNNNINILLSSYTEFEFTKASDQLFLSELIAKSLNKLGEYEIAIHKLKSILKVRSDLRDSWILFGYAYLNLEKYTFALSAFERAYDLDSTWPVTQYFLGLVHYELGNINDSIVYFNHALTNKFDPEIVIHKKLAEVYLENKDYEKSVNSYEKVLNLNKSDVNAYIQPIWIYLDFLNKPENAEQLAISAMTLFPNDPVSYNLLGWSQISTKKYDEALENLTKAITIKQDYAAAYYNLGMLHEKLNENGKAVSFYEKAYTLDTNGSIGNLAAKAYNNLKSN